MTWRLTIHYGHGDETHDLPDAQALGRAVAELRRDPRVHSYKWRRLTEPTATRDACLRCRKPYTPGISARERYCRCGALHIEYGCSGCRLEYVEPQRDVECANLPVDHEAIADRYSRKRWYSVRPD